MNDIDTIKSKSAASVTDGREAYSDQTDIPIRYESTVFTIKDNVRTIRGCLIGLTGSVAVLGNPNELIINPHIMGGARLTIDKSNLEILK